MKIGEMKYKGHLRSSVVYPLLKIFIIIIRLRERIYNIRYGGKKES